VNGLRHSQKRNSHGGEAQKKKKKEKRKEFPAFKLTAFAIHKNLCPIIMNSPMLFMNITSLYENEKNIMGTKKNEKPHIPVQKSKKKT
jgi:hypothetical protein